MLLSLYLSLLHDDREQLLLEILWGEILLLYRHPVHQHLRYHTLIQYRYLPQFNLATDLSFQNEDKFPAILA